LCQVQRTAWLLNGVAPPTFADRLQNTEPRMSYFVRTADGLRAGPDCALGELIRVEAARWPSLLEPWLEPSMRRKALPPAWSAECVNRARFESAVKITGANDGEVLHRAGDTAPLVRLELRGDRGAANWMINGRLVARTGAGERYDHRFEKPGRYEITAFSDAGRYDRISVSVR
jgi:penicillin-binding protein 1C